MERAISTFGAIVASLVDGFRLGLKIFGPLAKLLPNIVPDRDALQLTAPFSHRPELSRIHLLYLFALEAGRGP